MGMLAGLGLPHHAAEEYEREVLAGRTLVFVHTNGDFGIAELALNRAHPIGIHRHEERLRTVSTDANAGASEGPEHPRGE
jgi:hypothetical protein